MTADKVNGWTKLYYHVRDDAIWKTEEPFNMRDAYIDLLLHASYKDSIMIGKKTKQVIDVPEHAVATAIGTLAARWKWSENKVRRYLNTLTELQLVRVNGTRDGTVITLINIDKSDEERRADGGANESLDERADGSLDGSLLGREDRSLDGRHYKKYKNNKDSKNTKDKKKASPGFLDLWGGKPE